MTLKLIMNNNKINIFLCGDVMLARGIDMIQEYSCDPTLYEGNHLDAHGYVSLAEQKNGPIPPKAERDASYVWGHALKVLKSKQPDMRLINLETSITTNKDPWPHKGINYRMHPNNVSILKAANIDCCSLANNHTADWGFKGLKETLKTLNSCGIAYAGAGLNSREAKAPAIINLPNKECRVLVFSAGHFSSGVPNDWKATSNREGVNILDFHRLSKAVSELKDSVQRYRNKSGGDIVVLSVHWGGNWGFHPEPGQQEFAHQAIDKAGIDIVHGHSSHHVKGIEVHNGKPIFYGCGDFINDYEGIGGKNEFRGELSLMYFVHICIDDQNPNNKKLTGINMVPTKMKQLRVHDIMEDDIQWLHKTMERECQLYSSKIEREGNELNLVVD